MVVVEKEPMDSMMFALKMMNLLFNLKGSKYHFASTLYQRSSKMKKKRQDTKLFGDH